MNDLSRGAAVLNFPGNFNSFALIYYRYSSSQLREDRLGVFSSMRPTLLLLALSSGAAAWSWPWSSPSSSSSNDSCSKRCLDEHLNMLHSEELRCGDVTNDFCCRIVHVLSTTKESEWTACTEKCGVSLGMFANHPSFR